MYFLKKNCLFSCIWLLDRNGCMSEGPLLSPTIPILFFRIKRCQNLFTDLKQLRLPIILLRELTNWSILLLHGMLHQYDVYFITSTVRTRRFSGVWGHTDRKTDRQTDVCACVCSCGKNIMALEISKADERGTDASGVMGRDLEWQRSQEQYVYGRAREEH